MGGCACMGGMRRRWAAAARRLGEHHRWTTRHAMARFPCGARPSCRCVGDGRGTSHASRISPTIVGAWRRRLRPLAEDTQPRSPPLRPKLNVRRGPDVHRCCVPRSNPLTGRRTQPRLVECDGGERCGPSHAPRARRSLAMHKADDASEFVNWPVCFDDSGG